MPIYLYGCKPCDFEFEAVHGMHEDVTIRCDRCGQPAEKLIPRSISIATPVKTNTFEKTPYGDFLHEKFGKLKEAQLKGLKQIALPTRPDDAPGRRSKTVSKEAEKVILDCVLDAKRRVDAGEINTPAVAHTA